MTATTKPTRLKWGQTPWDNLSREELLRELQRAYAALTATNGALAMMCEKGKSAFWGRGGTGGDALEKARCVIETTEERFDAEDIYRAFFRYATDLLFPEAKWHQGPGWRTCDHCSTETNREFFAECHDIRQAPVAEPKPQNCHKCGRPMRAIEWKDLEPQSKAG